MAPESQLIRCLLCELVTVEATLEIHIKYNHLIYKESILKVLYNLHYPPVSKKNVSDMLDNCEDERNKTVPIKSIEKSPFNGGKFKRSLSFDSGKGKGKTPKKRKSTDLFEKSKKFKKEETSPKAKKPIHLKKTIPPRKKLQSNQNTILDEDVSTSSATDMKRKSRNGIDYDDVYTRKENGEKQTTAIQKIRQLQENELQCIMDTGTYVQCCDCSKWRLVKEFEDPSLVPEYWVCSMNSDEAANDCSKGDGEHVESDGELVGVEYSCGSLVWIKFPGYPWWPGMVDYCPEVEETFLLDEDSGSNEAAKYHCVFFDKPSNVARSWMDKDSVMKLLDPDSPPKNPLFKNENIKKRYSHAKAMAIDAVNLPIIERIEKYSFASLFTGKWGDLSDDSEDLDRRTPQIDIDARLVGIADFQQPASCKKTPEPKRVKRRVKKLKEKRFQSQKGANESCVSQEFSAETFQCLKCLTNIKLSRTFVENHLRKHRLNLQEYLDKYDTPDNKDKLVNIRLWVQNLEYLNKISEVAERRRSRSGSQPKVDDHLDESCTTETETVPAIGQGTEENTTCQILIKSPRTVGKNDEAPSVSNFVDDIPIETKTEPLDNCDLGPGPSTSSTVTPIPILASIDNKTKVYLKPPMSPELMIAIAVRNLDPDKEVGAKCSDIVAFLSLHFPYFTDNYEECKDMVRRECGMGSGFENGKENFQMKAEINCGDRIHDYVKNNRDRISRSMLEPEFLDTIIERFVKDDSCLSPSSRKSPPFSFKQLTYIALMKMHKRATLEQIVILLKFIFPSLASSGVMEDFRKEFLESIAKSKEILAEVNKSNITFSLKEDLRPEILDELRGCSMDNLELVGAALLHEKFFDLILPIFQSDK